MQAALDALLTRIDDPDLLAFVAGHLWNVGVALRAVDSESLGEVGLTRPGANQLARRFGRSAAVACRKAVALDPEVADRSPIIDVVLDAWPSVGRRSVDEDDPGDGQRAKVAAVRQPSLFVPMLRVGAELRLEPSSAGIALGFGLGGGLGLQSLRFHIGRVQLLPVLGVAYARSVRDDDAGTSTYSFVMVEAGLHADVWSCRTRRVQATAAVGVAATSARVARHAEDTDTGVWNGRFSVGYRLGRVYAGSGVHFFGGPSFWLEPLVVGAVF